MGASGLIGQECMHLLLAHAGVSKVHSLVRKPSGMHHAKLEERMVDFEKLDEFAEWKGVDAVICCLGTTMANAKTRDAFLKVDYEYPLAAAAMARKAGVEQYLIVSALGAHPKSTFFYNKVKGQLESAISDLDFEKLLIFQPSLLMGDRQEVRPGERTAQVVMSGLSFLMIGPLRKYKPIHAHAVARAMVNSLFDSESGKRVYPSDHIARMVKA